MFLHGRSLDTAITFLLKLVLTHGLAQIILLVPSSLVKRMALVFDSSCFAVSTLKHWKDSHLDVANCSGDC
jgi:hypothetical protein